MRLDPHFSAKTPRILVIDDDKGLREIIRMTLVPRCEVKTAASVDEGLKIFESLHPDIVIIDYQMPIKNGIQGIREIREIDPEVPVILLTAFADIDMAREAMDLGVTEYMTKPFNVTDLKQTIEQITRTPARKQAGAPEEASPESEPAVESVSPRFEVEELSDFVEADEISEASAPAPDSGSRFEIEPSGPALGRLFLKENYFESVSPKGIAFRANILRLNPKSIVCEVFNPKLKIQVGDVLTNCKIELGKPTYYVGKATIREIIDTGILLICEIGLHKEWYQLSLRGPSMIASEDERADDAAVKPPAEAALDSKVEPVFKKIVNQFGTLLSEIEDAMKKFESRLRATDTVKRSRLEQSLMQALSAKVVPAMNRLSDRFERVASNMPANREELHRLYVRHHLNRHFSFAPEVPLSSERAIGCPGDYRIPDRIFEPAPNDGSLFDKTISTWLISSPPGEAVGYRTHFLAETLRSETARCREAGRSPKIFSIARGPVHELEEFLGESEPADDTRITLLGFSEEAVKETREALNRIRRLKHLSIRTDFLDKSVNQFLAEGNRLLKSDSQLSGKAIHRDHYDLIYCSSLFHHFSDRVCQRFMEIFFEMLAPGGLIVVCDLTPRNPLRHLMNFVLDENLIHRTRQEMLALVPRSIPPEYYRITEVPNGVEVFLHVLKPESAQAPSAP